MIYNISNERVTIQFSDGSASVVHKKDNHRQYEDVVEKIINGVDEDKIKQASEPENDIVNAFEDYVDISVNDNVLRVNGRVVDDLLFELMTMIIKRGGDASPWAKFITKLTYNSSKHAIDGLYKYIRHHNMPITDEGDIVAFKKVRGDFTDLYSGTFDNSPGTSVQMARNEVDDDPNNGCSVGLHVCSPEYLDGLYTDPDDGEHIIVVTINPADVVAVPNDMNFQKMRVAVYEVVGTIPNAEHAYSIQNITVIDKWPQYVDFLDFHHQSSGRTFTFSNMKKRMEEKTNTELQSSIGIPRSTLYGWRKKIEKHVGHEIVPDVS